jgi:hypothetical protein
MSARWAGCRHSGLTSRTLPRQWAAWAGFRRRRWEGTGPSMSFFARTTGVTAGLWRRLIADRISRTRKRLVSTCDESSETKPQPFIDQTSMPLRFAAE